MSDVMAPESLPTAEPRTGHRTAWRILAGALVLGALGIAVVVRGDAIRAESRLAHHQALVQASYASLDLWGVFDAPPAARDLSTVTGSAHLGVPFGDDPYVRTEVVVNDPHVVSVLVTVRSDGLTSYYVQMARDSDGAAATDTGGCREGELHEGVPCLDWLTSFARQWAS